MGSKRMVYGTDPTMQKTELQKIELASCEMTEESLRVTQEMLRLCNEAQDAGAATLNMIHRQGEQLKGIENKMDSMHADLQEAETRLIEMDRCNGCCCGVYFKKWCLCCSRRHKETNPSIWSANADQPVAPTPVMDQSKITGRPAADGDFIPRITNDSRENEMENHMRGIYNGVGNLKNMAVDMGSEITKQNDGIDRTNRKASSNQSRLQSAQTKASNVLVTS